VRDAAVKSKRGVGESDGEGYFQIDAARGDTLVFTSADGESCSAGVGDIAARGVYASLGKVICR
jgi:hypothetical protein